MFYVIGYDVWLLPNFLVDNRKFLESLSPIIGYYPREDSIWEMGLRIGIFMVILGAGLYSYQNPNEFFEVFDLFKSCFYFVENWGYDKLTNMHVIYFNTAIMLSYLVFKIKFFFI